MAATYGAGNQYKKKQTEHGFQKIAKDVKNDNLPGVVLFFGSEDYLVRWAIRQIKDLYLSPPSEMFDFTKLDGALVSADEIIACCETLPIMSRKKVVLLQDFKPVEGSAVKGFTEEDEKKLVDYFASFPESGVLIITCGQPDKRRRLYKTIEKNGSTYDFSHLDEKQLISFIQKRFRTNRRMIESDVIPAIINLSGYYDKDTVYTLDNLNNDLDKIEAFSETGTITAAQVAQCISGNIDANVFAFIDALSNNQKGEAFQMLHNLLTQGEKEYKLLALICSQFEIMLSVKEMKEEGMSFGEMKQQLGIHEFRMKKAAEYSAKYSVDQLRKILVSAYDVDKNIKTGVMDSRLALELFAASV